MATETFASLPSGALFKFGAEFIRTNSPLSEYRLLAKSAFIKLGDSAICAKKGGRTFTNVPPNLEVDFIRTIHPPPGGASRNQNWLQRAHHRHRRAILTTLASLPLRLHSAESLEAKLLSNLRPSRWQYWLLRTKLKRLALTGLIAKGQKPQRGSSYGYRLTGRGLIWVIESGCLDLDQAFRKER